MRNCEGRGIVDAFDSLWMLEQQGLTPSIRALPLRLIALVSRPIGNDQIYPVE